MKRILVTGGAGFIGSHLCKQLLQEGHEVLCLDNYFTGNKEHIVPLLANPYFELIRHDITEAYYAEVDEIYNLACPASPVHYQYNPIKTIKTSVMGAIHMLGLAKRVKAKILQASTSEVYGDHKGKKIKETDQVIPKSVYAVSKLVGEEYIKSYGKKFGLKYNICRFFNADLLAPGV